MLEQPINSRTRNRNCLIIDSYLAQIPFVAKAGDSYALA